MYMTAINWIRAGALSAMLATGVLGCKNGGGHDTNNPAPMVSALSPSQALAGSAPVTVTVTGSGFVATSVVRWNASPRSTTFQSATQLVATITAADLATAGVAAVTVASPAPGGGTTGALNFVVENPMPTAAAVAPASVVAGTPGATLTVTGSGFVSGSVVQWNGSSRPTTFVDSTKLTATLTASDLAVSAAAQVTVSSPAPGGGTSAALTFDVDNPVPALTGINPSAIAAGSPDTALVLQGTGFVAASTALWNGTALGTTSSAATQLTVTVPAAHLLTLGDIPVAVSNPPPGGATSAALALHVGGPLRVSVAASGANVDGGSIDSAAGVDGRYVAFASGASNLVSADANVAFDVFVRDTCLGAPADCVPTTLRASVASDGTEGDGPSGYTAANPELGVAISGDGRYVAFVSAATNLVPGDTNGFDDVFVRDTCLGAPTGCAPTTTLVSAGVGGVPATSMSAHPAISRSGRFVAFAGSAPNLVAADGNNAFDIFVRDTCAGAPAGCVPSTSRASVDNSGIEGNADSLHPAFSGDERYLAFASNASNLVAGDSNATQDVFLRDTCFGAGAGCVASIVRVSLRNAGGESNARSLFPKVSLHGRYVGFVTEASNLVAGDTNTVADLYIRDTCLTAPAGCTPTTIRASLTDAGTQAGMDGIWKSALSDDGRYAAFESSGIAYVPTDPNPTFNVFVRDTCIGAPAGCMPSTTRLSAAFDGTPGDNQSADPALSGDGRFMTFTSYSSNLVPGGIAPGYGNVYVAAAH
jgi:hypothetical protein